ncbi:hypothetical protein HK098_000063 [Nowakowskiella sp. JEL0407]|nr:hypothetical protein HK098_000054 [Nowakowskiella sp. JEL0407]KAJ3130498.1 hypothetical protein HK098_000063 [Nowakowskiella sp. JEL0407]
MTEVNFSQLLQQSRQLTSHIQNTSNLTGPKSSFSLNSQTLPLLDRHLLQIDAQSKKLAQAPRQTLADGRSVSAADTSTLNNRTAFLFAQSQWDPDRVTNTLNSVQQLASHAPPPPAPTASKTLPHVYDSDVEAYLTNHTENVIISAINSVREKTTIDVMNALDHAILVDWDRTKNRFFEKLGSHQYLHHVANPSTGMRRTTQFSDTVSDSNSGKMQMTPKMKSNSKIIRTLNSHRLRSQNFALCDAFKDLYHKLDRTSGNTTSALTDTWDLLSSIISESGPDDHSQRAPLKQFHYAADYGNVSSDPKKPTAELRKHISTNGRKWLERQYSEFMHLQVQQHRAAVGGIPSIIDITRAYLQIRISQLGNWKAQFLEIHGGNALFGILFMLVRGGHLKDAVKLVRMNAESLMQSEDSRFPTYFEAWVNAQSQLPLGSGKISDQLRSQLLQEYNTRIRHIIKVDNTGQWIGGDAFKVALYKIIGRAELAKKSLLPEVMATTEDYLWVQLVLTCEDVMQGEPLADRYTLPQMSQMLQRFGADHFSSRGKMPIVWFKILMLVGEFERAIEYLWSLESFQIDAVHFAIVLAYYGLLRVPESPYVAEVGMTLLSFYQQPRNQPQPSLQQKQLPPVEIVSLNFARLIHQYTRLFIKSDPGDALQYIYLVALFGAPLADTSSGFEEDHEMGASAKLAGSREYTRVCHTQISDVIVSSIPSDKFEAMVGASQKVATGIPTSPRKKKVDASGGSEFVKPEIEEFAPVYHISTHVAYLKLIVKRAAVKADKDSTRFKDTVMLFDIAEEYDTVVGVINKHLAEILSNMASAISSNSVGIQQLVQPKDINLAEDLVKYYQGFSTLWNTQISETRKQTVTTLLGLHRFLTLAYSNRASAALNTLSELNLIPITAERVVPNTAVLDNLEPSVAALVPQIMVIAMRLLYEEWKDAKSKGIKERETECREAARGLVVFAGMVMFRIPQDVYAVLNRLDVLMG